MKLDRTFQRETKRIANGDGSREAKFAFIKILKQVNKRLSTTKVSEEFSKCIKEYGRVPVCICTAITIIDRKERLEYDTFQWAMEVSKLWTNRPPETGFAIIEDGLHPTRIEEYARSIIRATTDGQ